uniref:Lipid A biosynthesis acyltransferase n=1 Tax=uncultured Thiotrichaceae bacterium TaxID=298394 RepID=A0A6S6TDV5_9GAMM
MLLSRSENHSIRYDVLFPLLSKLPYPLAYRLADLQSGYFGRKHLSQKVLIAAQMRSAFPDAMDSEVEGWLRDYFCMVEQEALDTWFLDSKNIPDLVELKGFEKVEELRQSGQRVFLTGGHFSRFWMAGPAMNLRGQRVGTITRDGGEHNNHGLHPAEYKYRLYKLKKLKEVLGGPFLIEGEDLRPLYRQLDASLITLIFDVPYVEKPFGGVTVPFLEGSINVPAGIYRIAKKTKAVVVPFYIHDLGAGKVIAEFSDVIDPNKYNDEDFMSLLVSQLEMRIKAKPGHWWLWEALPLLRSNKNESRENR